MEGNRLEIAGSGDSVLLLVHYLVKPDLTHRVWPPLVVVRKYQVLLRAQYLLNMMNLARIMLQVLFEGITEMERL